MNPYQVVRSFESALCQYTGAPYAVTTTSCTMALLLACKYSFEKRYALHVGRMMAKPEVTIPRRTYVSVPMSIIHARGRVRFRDEDWRGAYQLEPLDVWDCARRFTSGMYVEGQYQCLSFHASKILGDTQGGAILHSCKEAHNWFKMMRFDGRTEGVAPKDDSFSVLGFHCYLSPDVAARLLLKLHSLPRKNNDLENDLYPDLSKIPLFSQP